VVDAQLSIRNAEGAEKKWGNTASAALPCSLGCLHAEFRPVKILISGMIAIIIYHHYFQLKETFAMKTPKVVLLISCLGVLLGATALANANGITSQKAGRITVYDAKEQCRVVCRAPKPIVEVVEDCFAYVLDIPLAMLSPIVSPVASCIPDENDRGRGKRYRRWRK
jgi:hypothetical protein